HPGLDSWISNGTGLIGLVLFGYAASKIWRGPVGEGATKKLLGRPAFKGGAEFTTGDGGVVFELGGQKEPAKIWEWISDATIPIIALQGESGAGKSSLLQGGIEFLLGQKGIERLDPKPDGPIPCVYCEMRPTNPYPDLTQAIMEKLKKSSDF